MKGVKREGEERCPVIRGREELDSIIICISCLQEEYAAPWIVDPGQPVSRHRVATTDNTATSNSAELYMYAAARSMLTTARAPAESR